MTDLPERLDLASEDAVAGRIAAMRALFPDVFREGKLDVDALRSEFGETVDVGPERFGLNWPGKGDCVRVIQEPSIGTLIPMRDDSIDFDTTGNVIIEGDNLEVLKLLQKAYYGKVSVIYVDPPYNTGNDFIYPDNFREGLRDYLQFSQQVNEDGYKFSANTESDGRYHSKWLSMIYPRLFLARNLLADSGIIAVQISDVELAHLRDVLDELFGEENYINTLSVKTKVAAGASGGGEDRRLKKNVEFILLYAKDLQQTNGFARSYTEEPLTNVIAEMRDSNQSWKYTSVLSDKGVRRKLATVSDGGGNPIDIFVHDGIKRTTINDLIRSTGVKEEDAYKQYLDGIFSDTNAQSSIRTRVIDATGPLAANQMYSVEYVPSSGRDKGQKVTHYYISNTVRRVIWLSDIAYLADSGELIKKERTGTLWDDIKYNNLGKEGGIVFPNGKKPVELIERLIDLAEDPQALVLDFFAGSGSTAHAVLRRNAFDGGSRRFILVQLPEPIEDTEFRSIAALARERVRRAAKEFSAQQLSLGNDPSDTGFKSYKLAASNFRLWDSENIDTTEVAEQLVLATNNVDDHATREAILVELLLKSGYPLTSSIETVQLAGLDVYSVSDGALLICLAESLSIEVFEAIAERDPVMILVLDSGFDGSDELKVNALQTVRARNQRAGSDIVLRVV